MSVSLYLQITLLVVCDLVFFAVVLLVIFCLRKLPCSRGKKISPIAISILAGASKLIMVPVVACVFKMAQAPLTQYGWLMPVTLVALGLLLTRLIEKAFDISVVATFVIAAAFGILFMLLRCLPSEGSVFDEAFQVVSCAGFISGVVSGFLVSIAKRRESR
ncbi:hypothetical protein [Adlercreutzia mucosicola]|uniref:hypothetical protein n=1 Tax=Adlercreutzia mucosicola TaxID=580026 RepID=UPI002B254BC3|nr:hypothetical protein [Adlercreutzia mucosicola]MEB1813880.1 hypothetical protein [Adlercreutzia mucosicola]